MLNISFIRENVDIIKEAARKKGIECDIAGLVKKDDERKYLLASVEKKRAEQNATNAAISSAKTPEEKTSLIKEMKVLKEGLQKEEEKLKEIMKEWRELMLSVPNIPDMSVPVGKSDADNKTLKEWGSKPSFSFKPKDHIELMKALDLIDIERGAKVHGFRGYFLKNEGALLSFALWNYARDFFMEKGFEFFIPPSIVNKEYLYGTGHLPNDANDLYVTQDGEYLSGTGEIPMMAYHADEIFKKSELPKKYLAFSPCYRREAGSYGKDTKGILRVHEFFKLEQLALCEANHETTVSLHEEFQRNIEEFFETLELPYRQVVISSGDLKSSQVKCYDTELWIPSQETYREIGSASYYHDFQSRRFNIRYDDGGVKKCVHSLNATALPTPRSLIALVENFQEEDGSVTIPEVLRPYLKGKEKISPQK